MIIYGNKHLKQKDKGNFKIIVQDIMILKAPQSKLFYVMAIMQLRKSVPLNYHWSNLPDCAAF